MDEMAHRRVRAGGGAARRNAHEEGAAMLMGEFQSEDFGELQRLVDGLYTGRHEIDRLDLVVQAEILDLAPDLMEIVNLLPPGIYERQRLCDQLNSALAAHGWGSVYGTVE